MLKKCKNCSDFIFCQTFLGECEQDAVDKLEDERQSEAFYETYLEDKNFEELEEKTNYLEQFNREEDEE